MRWQMNRIWESPDATIGVLSLYYGERWQPFWTLERPWQMNARNVSRIPEGSYELLRSPTRSDRLRLKGYGLSSLDTSESERFAVDLHVANRVSELEGCIAVGLGVQWAEWRDQTDQSGEPSLWSSRDAMTKILTLYEAAGAPVYLEIRDRF